MRRSLMFILILASVAILGAPSATATPTPSAGSAVPRGISVELGGQDFRTYCAACHGVGAAGDGTIAEFLTIAAPDLTKLRKLNSGIFPRDRVAHVIDGRIDVKIHGGRDMPVWGDWFDSEAISPDTGRETRELIVRERIESLVNYIETLQVN